MRLKTILTGNRSIKTSCVIFGCSDGILKITDEIPNLIQNNITIGLNRFACYYKTLYRIWIDNKNLGNCVYKLNKGLYEPYLRFEPNVNLFGAYTVASFALDFAVKTGFKRAVLYGVLDGEYKLIRKKGNHPGHWVFSYRHFYDNKPLSIPMQKLQQFKNIINSYSHKIQLEIPYMTI